MWYRIHSRDSAVENARVTCSKVFPLVFESYVIFGEKGGGGGDEEKIEENNRMTTCCIVAIESGEKKNGVCGIQTQSIIICDMTKCKYCTRKVTSHFSLWKTAYSSHKKSERKQVYIHFSSSIPNSGWTWHHFRFGVPLCCYCFVVVFLHFVVAIFMSSIGKCKHMNMTMHECTAIRDFSDIENNIHKGYIDNNGVNFLHSRRVFFHSYRAYGM